jgi:ABC-type taurine transport system ATPase subunit
MEEPQDLLELVGMEPEKTRNIFSRCLERIRLVLPEKTKFSLTMGGGLHYYMGLSRATMASTLNFLTIDAPIFNWPLIENSDQFARQMGLFERKIR